MYVAAAVSAGVLFGILQGTWVAGVFFAVAWGTAFAVVFERWSVREEQKIAATPVVQPAAGTAEATIDLRRKRGGLADRVRAYRVLVDGDLVGHIRDGERATQR